MHEWPLKNTAFLDDMPDGTLATLRPVAEQGNAHRWLLNPYPPCDSRSCAQVRSIHFVDCPLPRCGKIPIFTMIKQFCKAKRNGIGVMIVSPVSSARSWKHHKKNVIGGKNDPGLVCLPS